VTQNYFWTTRAKKKNILHTLSFWRIWRMFNVLSFDENDLCRKIKTNSVFTTVYNFSNIFIPQNKNLNFDLHLSYSELRAFSFPYIFTHVTYWKYLPCPPMPAAPNPVSAVLWSESESSTDPEGNEQIWDTPQNVTIFLEEKQTFLYIGQSLQNSRNRLRRMRLCDLNWNYSGAFIASKVKICISHL
jgi:hypothetical protein